MQAPNDHRPEGLVFDIQRMSLQDGPGIRTTVFLKGCPLLCVWCHNPEGLDTGQELLCNPALCIQCGACVEACAHDAQQKHAKEGIVLLRDRCRRCMRCASVCPSGALTPAARRLSVDEVLDAVLRDRAYYEASGGGLTVGGGEPLAQYEFTRSLLQHAKQAGLHCCLETCGLADTERLVALTPLVDIFLFDWKVSDPGLHRQYTGVDNARILENLHALDHAGAAITLRCPLIPELNLNDEHIDGIGALARSLTGCRTVHLLAWHGLGASKYAQLGKEVPAILTLARETSIASLESAAHRLKQQWDGLVQII